MTTFFRRILILSLGIFTLTTQASIKVYNTSITPRIVTKPADSVAVTVAGKTDKQISGGRIVTKVTRHGAIVKQISQNLCPYLLHTHCHVRANDLITLQKQIITAKTLGDGWYKIHLTVTDQDNEVILNTAKSFRYRKNCKAGFLCAIF